MSIIELNEKLAKAFDKLESGELDKETANAMVNVASAMTNNAKVLIQAAHVSGNSDFAKLIMSEKTAKSIEYSNAFDAKTDFAIKLGYKNISDAIGKMGKLEFEDKFKKQN